MDAQIASGAREGLPDTFLALCRVPADPGGDVHGCGPGLLDDPLHLAGGLPPADDQSAVAVTESGVQVRQAVREERQPVGCVEAGPVDGVVPHEQRDDLVRVPQSGTQHRIVVQTQVGGEQHHRDTTHGTRAPLRYSWVGRQAVGKSISATGSEVGSAEPPAGSTVMPIPDAWSTGPFSRTASSLAFGSISPAERIVPSSLNQIW